MATIKLRIRSKKNPAPIYLRLVDGRNFELNSKINININPEHWDNKNGKIRNLIAIPDRDKRNQELEKLKLFVLNEYNNSYMNGIVLDNYWFSEKIAEYFKRPIHEVKKRIDKHFIFVSDFAEWWLKEKSHKWKTGRNKFMSERQKGQYENVLTLFKQYEGNIKVKFQDFNIEKLEEFVMFLEDDKNYSPSTVRRYYGRMKFFVSRAKAEGIKGCDIMDGKIYMDDSIYDDVTPPYLNEDEIQKVMDLDLSHDVVLDSVRDNFIIGLWSGLRISDFNNKLDVSNIEEDYIKIKTTKTGAWVEIPLHPHIKRVLNKRGGALPLRLSDQKFNKKIKKIVQLCEIDYEMKGLLFDKETMRKVKGTYKKYELITSHTCRRSFATNLFGKVPNFVIQSVGGWEKEDMMLHYIKKTKREQASILKKEWAKKYKE